ncbi:MAG: DUF3619 family protein [Microbacteriaceae bacterium]|nr:DUF3619 family protein [Burkholderiaceae bacterium]
MSQFYPAGFNPAPPHVEALQGQVGLFLAAQPSRGCEALPHDIAERLRFARERAMAAVGQPRHVLAPVTGLALLGSAGRTAVLGGGPPSIWLRLASVLPLAVLVAGLVFIQQHYDWQQIEVAAEVDSALLADDLPPAAYGDPGFLEYLRNADSR